MEYFRHGPYLDVEFEDDPPLGAKHVKAELLNGVEDMLSFTSSELNGRLSAGGLSATYATSEELAGKLSADAADKTYAAMATTTPKSVRLDGLAGTYLVTTPDDFAPADDLDVRVLLAPDAWERVDQGRERTLVGKVQSWMLEMNDMGRLIFRWWPPGAPSRTTAGGAASITAPGGTARWVRAIFDADNAGVWSVDFYDSTDGKKWRRVGGSSGAAPSSIAPSDQPLQIGGFDPTGIQATGGRFYEVRVHDGVDGPLAAHFKADSLPYLDETGKQWTATGGVTIEESPVAELSRIPGRSWNTWQVNAASYSNPLCEWGGYQFAAFWGSDRYLRLAKRTLGADDWSVVTFQGVSSAGLLDDPVALDSHNTLAIRADADGYLHVAGNMHGDWIKYMRSLAPGELLGGWAQANMVEPAGPKTDTTEGLVTYPRFFTNPATGQLFFMYRNGASGNGNTYLNSYDTATKTWTRVAWLFDGGATAESAYENEPVFDHNGVLHLSYCWAAQGSGFNDRADVCYMRSADGGATWTDIAGTALTLPVTHPTAPIILPAGTGDGLLNQCGMTVDADGNPHIAHLWAPDGNRNVYHLYWNGTDWISEAVTPFTETGIDYYTMPSRPAIVSYEDRLLVIWTHHFEGWSGYVWGTDVTTPGKYQHIKLANMFLLDWEPAVDVGAARTGRLTMLAMRSANGDATNTTAPEYEVLYWSRQPLGVLTVDLSRVTGLDAPPVLPQDRPLVGT